MQTDAIKVRMADLGLTQALLAQHCGVDQSEVHAWLEMGEIPPSSGLLMLAGALGMSYEQLVGQPASRIPDMVFHGVHEENEDNEEVLGHARDSAMLLAGLAGKHPYTPPQFEAPADMDVGELANIVAFFARGKMGLSGTKPLQLQHLATLLSDKGVVLVPTPGRGGTVPLPAAMTVRCPEGAARFVVVNIAAAPGEVVRALAQAYAYMFAGPVLQGNRLARFAACLALELVPLVDVKFPTVLHMLCADDPTAVNYISRSEAVFATPIFHMLQDWQDAEGSRNPAFVARVLCMVRQDAVGVSGALWAHRHPRAEP